MTTAAVTTATTVAPGTSTTTPGDRARHLAERLEAGALALATLAQALTEEEWPASLYDDAPVTAQFVLEDHAVRHSYHHLAAIRRALAAQP